MRAGAVIVAAGEGKRMGGPKQFLPLCGRPVVEWTLKAFLDVPEIDQIVLVLSGENLLEHGVRLASERVRVVEGGRTRMGSVKNGLAALNPALGVVAVHDGARPLVTPGIILKTLSEALEHGAALAAVPAKDTLKQAGGELYVQGTPARAQFWLAQTPQSYRREVLHEALTRFSAEEDATDESQLVERAGQKVKIVPSSYENVKVTTPEDLVVAEALLDRRTGARREARTGFGYDIHRLVEGRELWLAGSKLPGGRGLLGHSDGDAVLHAAADAVLGAIGEGEIGLMFPPEDPKHKGIPSRNIVEKVLDRVRAKGGEIRNLDVTIVAESPRLRPHYAAMAASLSECFRVAPSRVNLKAKSHEGLGAVGRAEAIACYAVASVAVAAE